MAKKKDKTVYDELPTHVLDVDVIDMKNRIRQDMGNRKELDELADSLFEIGQLHPIVVERGGDQYSVRVGGRRYAAALILRNTDRSIGGLLDEDNPRRLDIGQILCIVYDELDDVQRLQIEIEENRKRKDFNKAEESLALRRLEEAMSETLGRKPTRGELANATGYSKAHVTMGLSVAKAVETEGRKELLKESSIFGAYRKLAALTKTEEIKSRAQRIKTASGIPLEELYQVGDGLEWLKSLPDEYFDFIHYDPPWGIGVDSYDRQKKYEEWSDDVVKSWDDFIIPSIPELYRTLKDDTWMVVWFGYQYYDRIKEALETLNGTVKAGKAFQVYPVPSIWYKTDKRGAQNDPSKNEQNVYEAFLKVAKGDPRLFKTGNNVYPYPMPKGRIHFAQKNVDMLVEILERYTFGKMNVGDPTAGSGAVFKACQRLGRSFEGRDSSEENVAQALEWLAYQEI